MSMLLNRGRGAIRVEARAAGQPVNTLLLVLVLLP